MGKRKRGNGNSESENRSIYSEEHQHIVECKKQCLSHDVSDVVEPYQSNSSSMLMEQNEMLNDELPAAAASDTRPMLQLRTSVRVQNKRMEEGRCEISVETLMKKGDTCSQDEEEESKADMADGEGKKRRRAWEVWLMEDKDIFFEAINYCGKDFEAIQKVLTMKLRRRGSVPKNKEQVRHFYYRTWHKLSKYVTFSSDVKKATQELYALINYGEIRRRVGGKLNEKKGQKLQELIQKGSASFRIKGRTNRVRTPICMALKKLNQITENRDQSRYQVPSSITLSLSAGNIESWSHVQSVAHNPRVRIKCPLHTQLSSIFSLLEHKWRSQEVKMCERLASSLAFPVDVPAASQSILRLKPEADADIKIVNIEEAEPQIRSSSISLSSHEKYLKNNILKSSAARHRKARKRKNLTENNKCVEIEDDVSDGELDCRNKSPQSQGDILENNDNLFQSDGLAPQEIENHGEIVFGDNQTDLQSVLDDEIDFDRDIIIKDESIPSPLDQMETDENEPKIVVKQENDALRQLKALQNVVNPHDAGDDVIFVGESTRLLAQIRDQARATDWNDVNELETAQIMDQATTTEGHDAPDVDNGMVSDEDDHLDQEKQIKPSMPDVEEIRKGWISSTCGNLKIGELYLMFGKKKTISLKYVFDDASASLVKPSIETVSNQEHNSEPAENGGPQEPVVLTCETEAEIKIENARKEFSDVLERLVTLVKSFSTKTPAGDCSFCGSSKSSAAVRSPANSRGSSHGRSPSHARSPRVSGNSKSPKTGVANPKANEDKAKPSSAKRLLACIPEEEEHIPSLPPNTEEPSSVPATSEKPIPPQNPVDPTGGFRIPLAPAPRVASSNSGFNAQLSKLLPRYSRPRRTIRKNVFVQRQLPLLPSTSKNSQGFITLKILPQPGDQSSTSATCMPPILPNQVIPINTPASTSNIATSSPISMPIISASTDPSVPSPAAISVNVSGQQLLTVQMPPITAEPPLSVCAPIQDSKRLDTTCDSFASNVPIAIVSTSAVTIPISAFNGQLSSAGSGAKCIEDFDVINVLSNQTCGPIALASPPRTPVSQSAFQHQGKNGSERACSTPLLPELKDISFLELTPCNSPSKSKFSLSPLNLMSDSSNLSLNQSPKQMDGKMVCVAPIKLNLSSILNTVAFNRLDAQEPSIPEIHIPDTNDSLPSLDLSIGTKISLVIQPNADAPPNPDVKKTINNNTVTVDCEREKKLSPTKLMDITLSNSNSDSSFSTLLSSVGQSAIDVESSDTLQTPPRSNRSQPPSVTKKDSNAPFGLSFKANLFASDYLPCLPTTTPSPPTSPSRLLQQSENNQWLNNELSDFSLSNLLSHLESPAKSSNSQKIPTKEDSCSLSSFWTDNSVDFVATFAKFKAQIAKDNCNET